MNTAQNTQDESKIRYIADLEDENDHWLSITDAARVCRVQDVSIRRAITAGRLPVRRQGAGDNKRTRFVRASDLPRAQFPILDSTAAITSDIRKVDVLSLPLQQQRLAEQLVAIQETQRAQAERYQQDRMAVEARLGQIQTDLLTALHQHQGEIQEALHIQAERYQQDHITLQEHLHQLSEQQEERSAEFRQQIATIGQQLADLDHDQAVLHDQVQSLTRRLSTLEEASGKHETLLLALRESTHTQVNQMREQQEQAQKHMQEHVQAQVKLIEQHMQTLSQEFERRVQAIEADEARDIASLTNQQSMLKDNVSAIVTKAETAMTATQRRMDAVDGDLRRQLQEEQAARAVLEQRLTDVFRLLQEEIATRQALSGEITRLKTLSPRVKKAQSQQI